ncbi:NAD(P)-dependent dehydrogenase (short-subunit alcohol dehydrogenase family) [Stenotrophomonas maltophilia]|uniref:SDR family NAD(P)-dependent oxidoreductase n=1 Tax=Stenotrophomonas chelatiphaga TaxID=517011 RepID=UPI000F4CF466|nr:SDR family oxidoreductase [Stenotrophomonas chelatiphaga]MCS4229366.1 NAD(P)-dependent dehydrogenase (short-subunit alcohol dehydrogenase family) [Stenotrophomonas chelatiphaga]ROQ46178.1 NAD(P)-dependent dehydrogenase (short-subunit alcohol dehydrogenase family) [Stenotrophomonas maltophilia]
MKKMEGKVALVVGGARGIGLAVAARIAAEGATVFITGRDRKQVEEGVAAIGPGSRGIVADASVREDIDRVMSEIGGQFTRLDALVLNAGLSEPASLAEVTEEHFDRHFSVNVRAQIFGLQKALGLLQEGAAVVLMGSVASSLGIPNYGTYAATKAALRSYARTWAAELAPRGIRINVVAPGPTDTEMMARVPDEVRRSIVAPILLGRMARPDEVASATLFLLSDESSFITGVELCVDGGMGQI